MPARRAAKDPSVSIGSSTDRFVALRHGSAEIIERSGKELRRAQQISPGVHHDREHLLERRRPPHAWR